MAQVTRTELNRHTAGVLARVAAGERLVVTDHGRPVAEISPIGRDVWAELVQAGRATDATAEGALDFAPVPLPDTTVASVLDELRAERL